MEIADVQLSLSKCDKHFAIYKIAEAKKIVD